MEPDRLQERVYTLREVAAMLSMTRRWVQKRVTAGDLPAERYGLAWRVRESDLLRFIEEHRHRHE